MSRGVVVLGVLVAQVMLVLMVLYSNLLYLTYIYQSTLPALPTPPLLYLPSSSTYLLCLLLPAYSTYLLPPTSTYRLHLLNLHYPPTLPTRPTLLIFGGSVWGPT